jgi:uncharacterized protein (TIRG00374 family)
VSRLRSKVKFVFGLGVSAICLGFLFKTVESEDFLTELGKAEPGFLLCAVIATLLSYVLRSVRWPFFFEFSRLTFPVAYRVVILGFFMNNVLPARMGEVVRAHLGGKATGLSRSIVLASILGERLADGITISLIFLVLFSIETHLSPVEHSYALYYVSLAFFGFGVLTLGVIALRRWIFRIVDSIVALLPSYKLSNYGVSRFKHFIDGLAPMFTPARGVRVMVFSLIVWFVELSIYYFVSRAFDSELSIGQLSYFMAAVNFSSLIPGAPGGIGVIELFTTAALQDIGVKSAAALSMVASVHVIQYFAVGIPGIYFFFSKGGRTEMVHDAARASDTESREARKAQA